MSAGTLTLTNNSAAVTGSGTAFNNELAAGDFIVAKVGGITYTLPIKTVGSDTQVVLVSKYPGPSLAGIAWQSVPRESQNQVTAELVAQTTAALRGLNYDKQNWQAVFSASGDITVMLPDGSTFTGPSWKSLIDILNNIDIDAVQQLADQVRADAQQVSSDKLATEAAAHSASTDASSAASANISAQTAKQDAETAAGTATSKASEASTSAQEAAVAKTAAEQAAATVHPENLLQKANHLSEFSADADAAAARGNLSVFSKAEIASVDADLLAKINATNARIDYAVISPEGTYAVNTRTMYDNPFGNNTPAICVAEFFHATLRKWISTVYTWTGTGASYGLQAAFQEGEGISVVSGQTGFGISASGNGASVALPANYSTASAIRIHVWKITA